MTAAATPETAAYRPSPVSILETALRDRGCNPVRGAARCPAHDDGKASLSYSLGENGEPLVFCHAGCSYHDILAALGLDASEFRGDNKTRSPRRIAATYDYQDEAGELLYEVVRYEPKDFRQRRPDGRGGWLWNMEGARRVLYRLPEVIEAVKSSQNVFVVEGEKDAETLAEWGLVGTCNVGGAGKWRTEFSEPLRGARVFVLPDRDEPGRKHGEQVCDALQGIAASVDVLELPAGKDVTEWRDRHGGTRETLLCLLEAASKPVSGLVVVSAEDLLTLKITPRRELLSPILREKDVWLVYAPAGTGKTAFTMSLAAAVGCGGSLIGWNAVEPSRVLYVDGELPIEILRERLATALLTVGGEPDGRLRLLPVELQDNGIRSLATPEGQHAIEDALGDAQLLIVDSISTLCYGGEENSAEGWQIVQDWLVSLRRRRVTVVLVHHTGVSGRQRGTTKRLDILDGAISLTRPEGYEQATGARFVLTFEKCRNLTGRAVVPLEVSLVTNQAGRPEWTWRTAEGVLEQQVRDLALDDFSVSTIARELGKNKGTVSKILKRLRERGEL